MRNQVDTLVEIITTNIDVIARARASQAATTSPRTKIESQEIVTESITTLRKGLTMLIDMVATNSDTENSLSNPQSKPTEAQKGTL